MVQNRQKVNFLTKFGHCQNVVKTLSSISKTLSSHCQDVVKTLSRCFQHVVKTLSCVVKALLRRLFNLILTRRCQCVVNALSRLSELSGISQNKMLKYTLASGWVKQDGG